MANGSIGRATKLTPEVHQQIVQALSLGAPDRHACAYAGISHETFYNWLEKGRAGKEPYRDFVDAVEKAKGRSVVGWLAKIEAAANEGSWQAAAWKLERRYPAEFGAQMKVEMDVTVQLEATLTQGMKRLEVLRDGRRLSA